MNKRRQEQEGGKSKQEQDIGQSPSPRLIPQESCGVKIISTVFLTHDMEGWLSFFCTRQSFAKGLASFF